ncbi:hypothetical protein SAMD00019534_099190 [Acytostelium subglobosum LB1]|uniref:hypothetical protein n=1 Tax=Acytostelium subglobosum LB1 TaxID=1410327 RepID=UPI000644C771|nr:hypothetical protein SAMD00019534_099190 [Acytostelium subglobosum LB1]GAM26744.1 hypothetical protein SAMD00019534_099190 [Acytostelium subglobosum LB1]|eukprot:XP_012750405.1 hypothetical protein SAMD00019534_099190 [Acytostelium subglobosum LB1]
MGSVETVILTEPEILREAFIDNPDMFINRHINVSRLTLNNCKNIASCNGDYHKIMRDIAMRGITSTRFKKMEDDIVQEINLLCDKLDVYAKSGEPLDPTSLIKMCSLNIIFRFSLSHHFPYDMDTDAGEFVNLINQVFILSGTPMPCDCFPFIGWLLVKLPKFREYLDFNHRLSKFLRALIEKRVPLFDSTAEPKDILDTYLMELSKGNITMDELTYTFQDLIKGGTDTTANTTSAMIKALVNRPELQENLYSELSNKFENNHPSIQDKSTTPYTNAVIKEATRRFTVGPLGLPHSAKEDCEFRGYHIKKGTQIIQNVYGTMNTPVYWKNPLEFDPTRFLGVDGVANSNVVKQAFGTGSRNCLGMSLAENELFMMTAIIFKRFKFTKQTAEPLDEDMIFGMASSPSSFKVIVERRQEEPIARASNCSS